MLHRTPEIPRPGFEVSLWVEQFVYPKIFHPIFTGPFLGGFPSYLHESPLSGVPKLVSIETAFPPNNGFHQHRVEMMIGRNRANERVVLLKTSRTNPLAESVDRVS